MATTQDIVEKLWNLCNVLRDDGITYSPVRHRADLPALPQDGKETGRRSSSSEGYRWDDLKRKGRASSSSTSTATLLHPPRHRRLRAGAGDLRQRPDSLLKQPKNLNNAGRRRSTGSTGTTRRTEGLGDLYEGLLEKNAEREEVRRRAVLHAAAADRLHGAR